jgi:capsular exopolysaccharide synthesis family protein
MQNPDADGAPEGTEVPQANIEQNLKRRRPAHTARPAALSKTPTLTGLLQALRRRWLLAISLGILLAPAVAVTVWVLRPITFTARTLLHVNSVPEQIVFSIPENRGDFGNYQRVQVALVKSRLVLNSALNDPTVQDLHVVKQLEDQLAWLEREIQADFNIAPEILKISMTGENTETLRLLVDAVRKAYLDEIVLKETKLRRNRLEKLRDYNDRYDEQLRGKRDLLKKLQLAAGSSDPRVMASRQDLNQKYVSALENELLKTKSLKNSALFELKAKFSSSAESTQSGDTKKDNRKSDNQAPSSVEPTQPGDTKKDNPKSDDQANFSAVEPKLPGDAEKGNAKSGPQVPSIPEKAEPITIPDVLIEAEIQKDAVVKRYLQEVAQIELDLANYRQRAQQPENEHGYKKLTQTVEAARAALAKRREQIRPVIVEQLQAKARDDRNLLNLTLLDKVGFYTKVEKELEDEIARRAKTIDKLNLDVVNVQFLTDEIAQVDNVNKEVARQRTALDIEIQAPPRVGTLEVAFIVPAQTESSRLRLAGGAGLGTFAAVLLGVAMLEFRRRKVNDVDEVVQGLKMKLVGSLPLVPRRALMGRSSAATNNMWQQRLTESVDAIRTTLLNAARFEGLRRVMVTSAVGGEGKTLLCCHLAVSLARAGYKTLLIDGDLRRPSVHKVFNLALGRGFSELLRGEADLATVANVGPLDCLHVVTAGQSDSAAIQNLAREHVSDVLQRIDSSYEFVIVDSAPVLPVADAQLIGQHVDGVVLSVMREVSRLPAVYAAYERLSLLRVRILGAVVNGVQSGIYQGSYYGYGSYARPAGAAANAHAGK